MKRLESGYRYLSVDADNLRHEIYVTSVGCLDHPVGKTYPSPGHPDAYNFDWRRGRILGDFAIIFLTRGSGTLETRSSRSRCRVGDAMLIPPGVWHRYRPDTNSGWREHWVCANGELLHRLGLKNHFAAEVVVFKESSNVRLRAAHTRLWESVCEPEYTNDMVLAATALEIFALVLRSRRSPDGSAAVAVSTGDPMADAAREYIWFNSHRTLKVGAIARHVGVSRRTLERRYVHANGVTVICDVIARRVARARQLLAETQMSVKEISYAVGFGDSRRLIRNFSRATGLTPAAFRRHQNRNRR